MKNFSKKLSFVMATAMVVTSLYAPQGAEAATANKIVVKNGKSAVKEKNIYIGGKVVDFDAVIKGKKVKDAAGTWKSSNAKVASVDKNGKVKALSNGKVTITFKTKATKKVKSQTVKMTIHARTRASKMILTPSAVVVKEGEKAEVGVSYEISKKIQAAGGKTVTYKLFAESSDENVKVTAEGNDKLVVEGVTKSATPATITVYAAQVSNLAKAKEVRIKVTEKFTVKVNGKFDAKQVKANKILVTGTNLSTKAAAYVVKNANGVVLNLKDMVEVNKDGTEATLEAVVNQIPEGKYTVTFEKEDPAEFTAVKAVLDKIVIEPADKAILVKGSDNKVAVAHYKALDNFGTDVTNELLGANIYANGNPIATKGAVRFDQGTGFLPGQAIGLVLVDRNTGKNASATLTISQYSMLSDITFKGVYDKKNKKFVESIGERDELKNYVMLFEGKDQYGLEMNAVGEMNVVVNGATGLKAEKMDDLFKVGSAEYMAFKVDRFTQEKLNAGEATIQAFSTSTGKQSTPVKFNITSSTEVKALTIGNGPKTIVAGEDAELSYSAYDADGKAVTDFEVLNRIKFTGGKAPGLRFVKKAGKAVLMYMPAADENIENAQQEYVTYITPSNNFGSAMLTVNPKRKPAKIAGLKKDTATSVTVAPAPGAKFSIPVSKVDLKDQYGDDFDVTKLPAGFALKVSFNDDAKNVFAAGYGAQDTVTTLKPVVSYGAVAATVQNYAKYDIVSASAVTAGATKVNLELLDKDGKTVAGSAYTINLVTTATSDVTDVRIEDIDLAQANIKATTSGGTDTATKVAIEVTGTVDGKRVKLAPGRDYEIVAGTDLIPLDASLTNGATEGKATVSIVVMDGKGTRVNKEYTFSKKAPVVASAALRDGEAGKVATASGVVTAKAALDAIKVKDQYGNEVKPETIYVTFSNLPAKLTTGDPDVEVVRNGGSDAELKNVKAGMTVTVKVSFPGSTYVFEKDVVLK